MANNILGSRVLEPGHQPELPPFRAVQTVSVDESEGMSDLDPALIQWLAALFDPDRSKKERCWYAYLDGLHRRRRNCRHERPALVQWADGTTIALCEDCGHQGWPVAKPSNGRILVIPRDLHEFLRLTGLSALAGFVTR